jgi:peptidoglycan/xylan/chitin deacetylase (PgdA/CDA1 family)
LAAISVDLDEAPCYAAIHGLPPPADESAHAIYRRAIPRFEALFDALDLRATFFVIGSDLNDAQAKSAVLRLHARHHELGNHSYDHRYDLTRLAPEAARADVQRGADAIAAVTGRAPSGFRAPGYTVSDALLSAVAETGARYDSSVFPCPSYYAAKALAMAAISVQGRSSRSVLDQPAVLRAPADPYRIGTPYHVQGEGLLELPIGVTRFARLPYIGTPLVYGGAKIARWLTRAVIGRPLVNLELHGIDLADAELDGLGWLEPHQPDLRRSVEHKRAALVAAIEELRGAGYRFVTLEQAAELFA